MSVENTQQTSADEPLSRAELTRSGQFYRPNVDISEGPEELVVHADMPGVRSEDIDIDFKEGLLTIHGKVQQRQAEGTHYVLNEYGIGDFRRTFQVSEQIDAGRINAAYKDGVLTLRLPKLERVKPRKIAVQVS
ncbi:MAG: Hsp20/alpha crystallin family protein [Planctomycetia bacterium]|nr:Hsp20/alpha crystallin family protein [Planctomycetia bacterium]